MAIPYSSIDHDTIRTVAQPKLNRLGFVWEDVEEIIPVTFPAVRMFLKDLPNSNTRVLTYSHGDFTKLKNAVRSTLRSWRLLRSVAVDTGEGLLMLLVLRCDDIYFEKAVVHWPKISNYKQLEEMKLTGDHWKGEVPRGLLCTMAVGTISDTGACALAYTVNHAIIDELTSRKLYADLTGLLSGGIPCEKVNWSLFSNIYSYYSNSVPAHEAQVSNLNRLQGIGAFNSSLWLRTARIPTQSFYTAHACNAKPLEATEATHESMIHYAHTRRLLNLQTCRRELEVRPAIITKAAIALYNCRVTRTLTALLAVVLSGRSWPFLDSSVSRFLPDPELIAGPTISMCTDVIKLDPGEAVGHMLKRLDREQRLITRHQHCPLSILGQLNNEDRAVWAKARKQIFNWLPFNKCRSNGRDDHEPVLALVTDKASKVDEEVDEFTWRCEMIDNDLLKIQVYASAIEFDMSTLESIVEQIFDIVDVLADISNWDQAIGEVVSFGQERA